MNLAGKNVLIVGFGKTGEALAGFLLRRGARVTVSEIREEAALGRKAALWKRRSVLFETGRHLPLTFLKADLIIPSPGAAALPEIRAAEKAGVPVLSEIELAARFLKGRIVGITGTNGKSTTVTLAHKILKEAGYPSRLAGNIGTPLISWVEKSRDNHIHITEISSFQLEHIDTFRPSVSVFLNLSQNHLDWHGTFEEYSRAKKRLVLNQGPDDIAILNADDRLVGGLAGRVRARVYLFSRRRPVRRGGFLKDGWIILRDGDKEKTLMRAGEIPLPGLHNLENVLAAALVGWILGADVRTMRSSIRTFSGLEHRLENVLSVGGVEFINDSKATTVDATIKALQSYDRGTVLILGGRDKGADFRLLRRPLKKTVKQVVLLGESADKIATALRGIVPSAKAVSMGEAVRLAFAAAGRGDIVLLAPACTSFDMFRNFEARGRAFKREVRKLSASPRGKKT
ncbi:MAG: UDP-N-acetylmuramoyl-L-alanine--D-glutamate ligase [Candidatus Aminicenantes bacterium]|nr:UDP-N-acetylmuramoyl-L-alanine--D-glutamate ligase [Candidatus Aminicenantes bacterium]